MIYNAIFKSCQDSTIRIQNWNHIITASLLPYDPNTPKEILLADYFLLSSAVSILHSIAGRNSLGQSPEYIALSRALKEKKKEIGFLLRPSFPL